MIKEQPKQFSFFFPVFDDKTQKVITCLFVKGNIDTGRLNEALEYKILSILFFAPGEVVSSDIKTFLFHVNRELYDKICAASLNHATEKFGLKKHAPVTP